MTKIQGRMDSLRRDRRCEIPASAGMMRWVRGNDGLETGPFDGAFDSAQDRLRVSGGHRAYMTKIQGRTDSPAKGE